MCIHVVVCVFLPIWHMEWVICSRRCRCLTIWIKRRVVGHVFWSQCSVKGCGCYTDTFFRWCCYFLPESLNRRTRTENMSMIHHDFSTLPPAAELSSGLFGAFGSDKKANQVFLTEVSPGQGVGGGKKEKVFPTQTTYLNIKTTKLLFFVQFCIWKWYQNRPIVCI